MYKLQSKLNHFKYNSSHQMGPTNVVWYKIQYDEEGYWDGVSFNQVELKQLTDYMVSNKINFSDSNYHDCNDESELFPCFTEYDLLPFNQHVPQNLVLKKIPKMPTQGSVIYSSMDIKLLKPNGSYNHDYNLDFDIVGVII